MAGDPKALYLESYAEGEARAVDLPRRYRAALVVPAFDEPPDLLSGLRSALDSTTSLCVVVVNAAADADPEPLQRTRELARSLCAGAERRGCGFFVDRGGRGDLLIIDRASTGAELPSKQGVGLARKIGCDVVLAAASLGMVDSPWIHTTDADAQLDADYFAAADALAAADDISALSYPFWHHTDDSLFGQALAIYECSLRYYVLGLGSAGSPYAFHSIGSCMAIHGHHYAVVRGVPKRQAGEDFYLLNKLAKEGRIAVPRSQVALAQRASQRTPFGTGERTGKFARFMRAGKPPLFYNPEVFSQLGEVLRALSRLARDAGGGIDGVSAESERALEALGLDGILDGIYRQAQSERQRAERLRRWFDGFRTLRFVHELERAGYDKLPWNRAIDTAPFCPELAPRADLRRRLAAAEARLRLP